MKRLPTSFVPEEGYGFFFLNVQLPPAASLSRDGDHDGGQRQGMQPVGPPGIGQEPREEPRDSNRRRDRRHSVQTVAAQQLR